MNVQLLIDSIVRQTTLLIASLATASGGRAPLSHVAGQVFLELVRELKAQGLGHKVIADMFGLALRTYHDRVRRLSESATDRGMSLWEAVLGYVRARQLVTRAELLRRFHADDQVSVRGVLKDLVESGLLFKSGREDTTTYRAATLEELGSAATIDPGPSIANMTWVVLHQEGASTAATLAERLTLPEAEVRTALATLVAQGRVRYDEAKARYVADHCVIPYEAEHGWEAAVFDHFQALVTALVNKLQRGQSRAHLNEAIGGSTYHFDIYPGHPREREVLSFLAFVRKHATELRTEVEQSPPPAGKDGYRVVFYAGQNVIGGELAESHASGESQHDERAGGDSTGDDDSIEDEKE